MKFRSKPADQTVIPAFLGKRIPIPGFAATPAHNAWGQTSRTKWNLHAPHWTRWRQVTNEQLAIPRHNELPESRRNELRSTRLPIPGFTYASYYDPNSTINSPVPMTPGGYLYYPNGDVIVWATHKLIEELGFDVPTS